MNRNAYVRKNHIKSFLLEEYPKKITDRIMAYFEELGVFQHVRIYYEVFLQNYAKVA